MMTLTVEITRTSNRTLQAVVYSPNVTNVSGYYAEIALWVDDKEVENFDGVAELPEELQNELSRLGFYGW